MVSVVIGSYNRLPFLQATIETLRQDVKEIDHEIIVVDGGSDDGTIEWLIAQKDIISMIQHNRGEWRGKPIERKSWGYFMNLGFKIAQGKYICMLSDDCLVLPSAMQNGIDTFETQLKQGKKVGAVAFYWRNWPEQQDYWVGIAWGDRMFVNHGLYLREVMEKINFADEDNYFFYHADGDICLRLWEAGYVVVDSSKSFIEHYSDANTAVRASNQERQQKDWATYTKRWQHLKPPKQDWLTKAHRDPSHLADKYWGTIEPTQSQAKGFLGRLKK